LRIEYLSSQTCFLPGLSTNLYTQYFVQSSDERRSFYQDQTFFFFFRKIVRPRDLATGKLRRFCYVRFEDSKSVDTALEMLNPMIDDVELKRKASQGYALKIPK
jgi:RNA recognition motif-containing protein